MFAGTSINHRLLKAIAELGFHQPTPVQEESIPLAARRRDLIVSAPTGSGKTVAYLLPMLHRLLAKTARKQGSRALVLVPTRELAHQVLGQCQALTVHTKLDVALICGGDDIRAQVAALERHPEVVIATPGRLMEHLEDGAVDFNGLEVLVLDEADRMLDMGFADAVVAIAGRCNDDRQTLLYSATMNHKDMAGMVEVLLNEPEVIELSGAQDIHADIRQQVLLADDLTHKEQLLNWLLTHEPYQRALVFCNTRDRADWLGGVLVHHRHRVGVLHGDKDQIKRNRVMELFREDKIKVLVATDVAARGLDVRGVDLVINFDMARNGDAHVHRVGRTGRAGEQGLAISMISPQEWNLMAGIERYLQQRFERRVIKGLEGSYKGPKKLKASGKAAGTRKKKNDKKAGAAKKKR